LGVSAGDIIVGYGDVRPLPGAVAWIRELRAAGKKIALAGSGERARAAIEPASPTSSTRSSPVPATPARSPR
jgi:hypothetical protein